MKVTGINEGSMANGQRVWLISMDGGTVIIQRRELRSATESPMSHHEQLTCELCEFAQRRGSP